MLILLLKSSACLAVFMLFYKLSLEKTSAHIFKRFYLIGAVLVSICIPFITFTEYIEVQPEFFIANLELNGNDNAQTIKSTSLKNYIPVLLWSIYLLGSSVFAFRFFKNLNNIYQKIKGNPKFKNENIFHVLLQELITPHTFLNYIFFNKTKYEHNQIPQEVILHEQTHANQKHALDIIFIELLQILFWFNPLLYFIKKDIKLNHEFLADQAVLNKGIAPSTYQNILLAFSSSAPYTPLANAINYSLIKKRFTVMKTKTSKRAYLLKGLFILPILAILIYNFSQKEIIEKEVVEVQEPFKLPSETEWRNASAQQTKTNKGATVAMMVEYKEFIEEFEKSNTIWMPRLNRAIAIYDLMTDAQRASVKKYPETKLSNLTKIKPKTPTETLFKSWKNKTEFALWIDGKVAKNSELNKYIASDFKYYTSSFVYNNARSKRFPQPYQNHLYTKKGFEESYLKRNIKNYNALRDKYNNAIKNNVNESELRILKIQVDKSYKSLSEEEIQKYNIKKPSDRKRTIIEQQATPKEIAEYNKLAKHINNQIKNKGIVKLKEITRLKHLYSLMSKSQKKRVDPYPDLSLLPPPPAMDTIYTYNSLAKRAKLIPKNRKNNIQYLKVLFNKMSDSQKEKVESPNSVSKYIAKLDNLPAAQIEKANKVLIKIKTKAQSEGRKFFTASEYNELEELYDSLLSDTK